MITLFFLKINTSGVFIVPTNIQLVQKSKIYSWLEMTQLGSPKMGGRAVMTAHSTAHTVQLDIARNATPMFKMEPAGYLLHWWNGEHLVTHHVNSDAFDGPHPFFEDSGQLIT